MQRTRHMGHECHTIPHHTQANYTITYHTIPYNIIPYNIIPYHIIPYHIIPYHTISYNIIPYNIIPIHIIPYHTMPAWQEGGPAKAAPQTLHHFLPGDSRQTLLLHSTSFIQLVFTIKPPFFLAIVGLLVVKRSPILRMTARPPLITAQSYAIER